MRASASRSAMALLRYTSPSSQASPPPGRVGRGNAWGWLLAESSRAWSIFSSSTWLSKGLVR